jgi:hypothetical protein
MKSFKQYITEEKIRYDSLRADGVPFVPRSDEYRFTADGTGSGRESTWGDWPKSETDTLKTGLFAAEPKHAAPYSMPRDIRWLRTDAKGPNGRSQLFISSADYKRLRNHRTVASHYDDEHFSPTGRGEHFASGENVRPTKQVIHNDPLAILRMHHIVRPVRNLDAKKKSFIDNDVQHETEGEF